MMTLMNKVTVDTDMLDDEDIDYIVSIEMSSLIFNKLMYTDLQDLPIENHQDILIMLGEMVRKAVQDEG